MIPEAVWSESGEYDQGVNKAERVWYSIDEGQGECGNLGTGGYLYGN